MQINSKCLGLAGGILWGLCMFGTTLISSATGYASGFMEMMAGIYPGYWVGVGGAFVGLVYGFLDGFIGLFVFAVLYNFLEKKFRV